MTILLIEDDVMIGRSISRALADVGIGSEWITDGVDGDIAVREGGYDLVLLDLGLPRRSGLKILAHMRERGDKIPVLIVTARDELDDRVTGLDLGADDYLVKPFGIKEMLARIRAILRRHSVAAPTVCDNGEIAMELETQHVTYRGTRWQLPPREFALLHILVSRSGTVLSRSQIEELLYAWRKDVGGSAVEVLIHYIRKKFGHDIIRNVRGVGWMVVKQT